MQGEGKMVWPDGKVYTGNFYNDLKNGEGKLTTAEGKVYEGTWINGKFNDIDFNDNDSLPDFS